MDHNRTVKTFLQNMTLEENTSMRPTGIVRRIDDLGRIVVPKEIRRVLRILEGDPLEIFTGKDGEVIIKKYSPLGELGTFAQQYVDSICFPRKLAAMIAVFCSVSPKRILSSLLNTMTAPIASPSQMIV